MNRSKEKADKRKRTGTIPLLLGSLGFAAFIFVCLFFAADMRYKESLVPAAAVSVNGSKLGYMQDFASVENAVNELEDDYSLIYGESKPFDIVYGCEIELTDGKIDYLTDKECREAIAEITGVAYRCPRAYSFYIDGIYAGTCCSRRLFDEAYLAAQRFEFNRLRESDPTVSQICVKSKVTSKQVILARQETDDFDALYRRLLDTPANESTKSGTKAIFRYNVIKLETTNTMIPIGTSYEYSSDWYQGYSFKSADGSLGIRSQTYEVEYDGGREIGRSFVSSKILAEMKPDVYTVGSKITPRAVATGTYKFPVRSEFHYSSLYGEQRVQFDGDSFHYGIDIVVDEGTPVFASDGGRVSYVNTTPSYGTMIIIDHANYMQTCYAHLSEACVNVGDWVYQWQHIAYSGNTGVSTAPHLHFEMRFLYTPIDPFDYLEKTYGYY
ncbi:MAG: peptidoglycan DD-metalloendopeptidase family protein [Clostridiales bacterium]|nr:peptidoglycan DD-metalloendopeptidase family protein [Clostridiales bacterium]